MYVLVSSTPVHGKICSFGNVEQMKNESAISFISFLFALITGVGEEQAFSGQPKQH